MSQTIKSTTLCADSAQELCQKIKDECKWEYNGPQISGPTLVGRYALIYGPPDMAKDSLEWIKALPQGIVIAGSSMDLASTTNKEVMRKTWGALLVQSIYITPAASFIPFEDLTLSDSQETKSAQALVENFIQRFPQDGRSYFAEEKVDHQRTGAHGVRYRRPGYLLTILPGAGYIQKSGKEGDSLKWPEGNMDFQIVSALSERTCHELTVFGYSATGRFKNDPAKTWMFARSEDGMFWNDNAGVAAILVQTDLKFGCSSADGFVPSKTAHFNVAEPSDDPAGILTQEQANRRERFHTISLTGDAAALKQIQLLSHHTNRLVGEKGRLNKPASKWTTLGFFEGHEFIPNPAYRHKEQTETGPGHRFSFILPLSLGEPMTLATTSRESFFQAAPEAIQKAMKKGGNLEIWQTAFALVVNCRGRHWCLDTGNDESVREEHKRISGCLSPEAAVTMLYADGETSPIHRNQPYHRTWSVSALVMGSEFDLGYLTAAKNHFLSLIDRAQGDVETDDPLLEKVLHAGIILTQADGGHIRLFNPDNLGSLEKRVPFGDFSKAMTSSLPLVSSKVDMSIRAYQTMKTSWTTTPYKWRDGSPPKDWKNINQRVKCRVGEPIIAGGSEVLGVLSINSTNPNYYGENRVDSVNDILSELARRTSYALKAHFMRANLLKLLSSFGDREAIPHLIENGAKMLCAHAILMLLLPDPERKTLRCNQCYPAKALMTKESVYVSIDPNQPTEEQGISGHLYLNPESNELDHLFDDVNLADGKGGKPLFKNCLGHSFIPSMGKDGPDISQNYAVVVRNPKDKSRPLGILVAEAPQNMLDRERDLPLLKAIASACENALLQQQTDEEGDRFLNTLLPKHIVEKLKRLRSGEGRGESIPKPAPKRTTILNGDIRGYTRMSEIVGEANMLDFQYEYFEMVAKAVQKHNGILDKFMGDGVMALFDSNWRQWEESSEPRTEDEDDAITSDIVDAVNAGLEIAALFEELAKKWVPTWRKRQAAVLAEHPFTIGVAVHCGNPISGLFSTATRGPINLDSLPADGHTTYTIMGRDANLGARVCSAVKNNTVWVTAPCRELLLARAEYRDRLANVTHLLPDIPSETAGDQPQNHPVKLKGIPHPIDIFEVAPVSSKSARRRK